MAESADNATKIAAAVSKGSTDVTVWNLFQSGGFTMLPLAFMSILALMLIFAYLITLRRGAIVSNQFMNTAEVLIKKGDYAGLLAIANRHNEAVARVVRRTLDFASKNSQAPFEVVREIAQTEGGAYAASMQNRITYLADIAVLSPMVGLLGTVFGIIRSFGVMASTSTSEASRPVLLAHGVSEALVATGTGLIIGILSMAFYGIFRNKVQNLLSEMERATAHLLGLMSCLFVAAAAEPAPRSAETASPEEGGRPFKIEPRRRPEAPRRPSVSVEDEF